MILSFTPPIPPAALISSCAISMPSFAVWPHSAPLPDNGTMAPIFTVRPESSAASASAGTATNPAAIPAIAGNANIVRK